MSKNRRIARRRQALMSRLVQGEPLDTVLKKLRITPGRALQMLTSRDALEYWLQHFSVLGMQEAFIFRSSVAPASLTLRRHLTDDNASPELRVKAANAILAQRPKPVPPAKPVPPQDPPEDEDNNDWRRR